MTVSSHPYPFEANMPFQEALLHPAGHCSSIALFEASSQTSYATLLARVAHLLDLIDARDPTGTFPIHRPENLHVLVGLSARSLGSAAPGDDFSEFPAEGITAKDKILRRGDGQVDAFVQIAAPTEGERRYGLRLAVEVLKRGYGLLPKSGEPHVREDHQEVHGARLFAGLEPFGYLDSVDTRFPPGLVEAMTTLSGLPEAEWVPRLQAMNLLPQVGDTPLPAIMGILRKLKKELEYGSPLTLPTHGALQQAQKDVVYQRIKDRLGLDAGGPSFLLYQKYIHKFDGFTAEDVTQRLGKAPGQSKAEAAPFSDGSHLKIAQESAAQILRRGFGYRDDRGAEGIAFVGLARSSSVFLPLLRMHLEHDRLLERSAGMHGGVYVVPPSSAWVRQVPGVLAECDLDPDRSGVPAIAKQLLRPQASPIPKLEQYQIIPEVLRYVELARARGVFLEPTMVLRPDVEAKLVEIEQLLAPGSSDLADLRDKIRKASAALYHQNGGYMTLGA